MSLCSKELVHAMVGETSRVLGGTGTWPVWGPGCQPALLVSWVSLLCAGGSLAAGRAGAAIPGCECPSVPAA